MKPFKITVIIGLLLPVACITKKEIVSTDQMITKPVVNIQPTKEQTNRRAESERYCMDRNIPVYQNKNSLFVDSDEAVTIRTKDEVVDRALALCYIGLKSEGLPKAQLDEIDKDYHISPKLSNDEKIYAETEHPTSQQTVDANWRYEDLHILLWALGFIDTLDYPGHMCDVASDSKIIHDLSEQRFRDQAKLRSKKEILDQADLILRLHWACVSASLESKESPGKLNWEVVMERHHALNWLINSLGQSWDEVSTDT